MHTIIVQCLTSAKLCPASLYFMSTVFENLWVTKVAKESPDFRGIARLNPGLATARPPPEPILSQVNPVIITP